MVADLIRAPERSRYSRSLAGAQVDGDARRPLSAISRLGAVVSIIDSRLRRLELARAKLGDFQGRVTALGPVLTYSFALGKIPVSTQWSYFHEFDVENRMEGDAGLLTISMPL